MIINSLPNKILQKIFGINDRRSMRDLSRADTIAIYYRGKYMAARIDKPQSFGDDKRYINIMLKALGFRI